MQFRAEKNGSGSESELSLSVSFESCPMRMGSMPLPQRRGNEMSTEVSASRHSATSDGCSLCASHFTDQVREPSIKLDNHTAARVQERRQLLEHTAVLQGLKKGFLWEEELQRCPS